MDTIVKTLRDAIVNKIQDNPSVITPHRRVLESDGFGGEVKSGKQTERPMVRVRISKQSGNPPTTGTTPAGLDPDDGLYVLTDYHIPLKSGDLFEANGASWEVGAVEILATRGAAYASRAQIKRCSE